MAPAARILIVDDDPATLKMLEKALAGMGELHSATGGAQALQIVAEHPIDLVLLDIIMPEMDGFATCRALLQAQPDITVLFVTVVSDSSSEVAALEVGGRDFINKPINPPVVRARVALHLKLRAQHSERQRIEGQWRVSEQRFRDLFEHLPIAYQSLDHQGRWLYANQAMADLLGYESPDALLGGNFGEYWDEATRDQFPDAFAALKAAGGTRGELRLRRRDGSALTAIITWRVEQDGAGRFLQTHCVLVDISERRAMEEAIRALNANLEQQVDRRTADLRIANAALRESEARYRLLFDNIADPIITLDLQGQVIAVNDQACRRYGYTRDEFLTLQITDIDTPEDAVNAPGRIALLDQQGEAAFEAVHRDAGGRVIPVEVRATKIMFDGQPAMLFLSHDITVRKQAEEAIQRSRADLERAQALAHIGNWSMDLATHRVQWSEEMYRIFEIEIGTPISFEVFLRCVHSDDRSGIAAFIQQAASGKPIHEHMYRIIVDAGVKWIRDIIDFQYDEHGMLVSLFGTPQDITAQEQARRQIEYLAYHDDLTGLPNRVMGQYRLQQAVTTVSREGRGLAVLHLDLDKFKYINDTHGHYVGDQLLKAVAGRLSHDLGAEDTLCRLSGDEFMLVLPQAPSPQVVAPIADACDRVLSAFARPFDLDGLQLFVTLSIGVAIYPRDGADGETLMRHANTALFEAERAGQHSYRFFAPQMNADLIRFVQTRDRLRAALEHRELELYYQPQLDLHSSRVVGVEALIRWHRPVEGLTLPAHFIAVAEESGLIVPISQWALREACRQAAAWCELGWTDCVVAVNLSAVHFRQGQVEQDVMAALEESGLDPANLELELTESTLLENIDTVIDIVARWKARGIRLSIDDFGTGYSSLAYLKRFKVDKLKIDRSFISNLQADAEDCAIVEAIIRIARSLNLRTVAEGVENATQANQLKFIGCDEVQGYFYSEPLPAAELEQWLSEHGCFPRRWPWLA